VLSPGLLPAWLGDPGMAIGNQLVLVLVCTLSLTLAEFKALWWMLVAFFSGFDCLMLFCYLVVMGFLFRVCSFVSIGK
jgi:hypothetical protein